MAKTYEHCNSILTIKYGSGRFCNPSCSHKYSLSKRDINNWLKAMSKPKTEKFLNAVKISNSKPKSEEHKKKLSIAVTNLKQIGEKNPNFKHNNMDYRLLHIRLRSKYNLGIPTVCVFCGVTSKTKKITWAAKNRYYVFDKINKKDWLSLCYSCHKKYDLELIKNESNEKNT